MQLTQMSKTKSGAEIQQHEPIEGGDDDTDSNYSESGSNSGADASEHEAEEAVEVVEDNEDGEIEEVEIASTESPAAIREKVSSGRYLQMLIRVPNGKGIREHLQDLKDRPTAHEAYASAMGYPKGIVEERLRRLELDGRPVRVMDYASEDDVEGIVGGIKKYEPRFDVAFCTKSQLKYMPFIEEIFVCYF